MLVDQDQGLYDLSEDADDEGDALVDSSRAGYRQVAAVLRERIISGKYPPRTQIPGQAALAAELNADIAVVNKAVQLLERQRLVRVGHGRPTIVRGRRAYRAVTEIPWREGTPVPGTAYGAVPAAARAAAAADAELAGLEVAARDGSAVITVMVTAADAGHAADRAMRLAETACGDTGWDLDGASVRAEPAG